MTEVAPAQVVRAPSMDALRTLLVAWIIGGHALLGYTTIGGWAYDEVNEVSLHPQVELVLMVLIGPTAIFLMGTFFLLAGMFTPSSLERKGVRRFTRDRLLRLGLPFLVSLAILWPATLWTAYRVAGHDVSYRFLLTGRHRLLDSGALWFAEVLLIFSLAYAGWTLLRTRVRVTRDPWSLEHLMRLALVIATASFVVRLWFTARGRELFDLHLWQWPQLIGMFVLGIACARAGAAERIPADTARKAGWVVLGVLVSAPLIVLLWFGVRDPASESSPFLGGWTVEAGVFVVLEGLLVVFGSVWLLAYARRRLHGTAPWWQKLHRASFAAFFLQGPVLIGLAVALRPVPAVAEVKAVLVLVGGLVMCFGLGWLLVSRTRVGRIL